VSQGQPASEQLGRERRDIERELRRIWQDAVDHRQPLPGEHALAAELGVSRPRIREQLVRLEQEGLIARRRGAETVVNIAAGDIDVRFDTQIDYAAMLRERGYHVAVEVLSASLRQLQEGEPELFAVPSEWSALNVVKRWRADGEVLVVADDILPVPPQIHLNDLDLSAEIAALAAEVLGVPVEWTIAEPGALLLDETLSARIEQPAGSAVLSIDITGVGRDGRRSFRARELHVPGRVRFGFIRSRHLDRSAHLAEVSRLTRQGKRRGRGRQS
jgi:GntR family transcriptional regulator